MEGEKIYPIYPDTLQRHLLIELLKKHLENLDKNKNPEAVRQLRSLYPLYKDLEKVAPEFKVIFLGILEHARAHTAAKYNKYAVMAVSKRKFIVVSKEISGTLNYTVLDGLGPYDPNGFIPHIRVKALTSNMGYAEAQRLFAYLILGRELPDNLKKHLLSEQEGD